MRGPADSTECLFDVRSFFFAHSTNSLTFLTGIDALIAMAAGALAVMPIGSKSFVESYLRFG